MTLPEDNAFCAENSRICLTNNYRFYVLLLTEFHGNTAGDHRTMSPEHPLEGAKNMSVEEDNSLNGDDVGVSDDSDIVDLNVDLQRFLSLEDAPIPRQTQQIC